MNSLQRKCTVFVCFLTLNVFGNIAHAKQNTAGSKKVSNIQLQKAYARLVGSNGHMHKSYSRANTKRTKFNKTTSRHASIVRNKVVVTAKKQLRKKYRWGGASPKRGFDCSGLVQYAYKSGNIQLPRTAAEQYRFTKRVSLAHLKVGDLIFFHTRRRSRSRINHVGIYMGGGNFIHAPRRGQRVSIAKLGKYWKKRAVGAGRV